MPPAATAERFPLILLLDNVRSLHNVGAIFRTADACDVQEVILCGMTPVPPRHEIAKTSLGATETVPWRYALDASAEIRAAMALGITPYALEITPEATDIFATLLNLPALLVVGHERMGVSPAVLEECRHLRIPMHGKSARSLNVSTATGIAAYAFRAFHGTVIPHVQ